jgi:leader peptidase (prepilin peptidase)/N-methyltransferase
MSFIEVGEKLFTDSPGFEILALGLGLVLGSFANVCIHRFLSGESVVAPRSKCPSCGHELAWWENIPLVSFLVLRGRCRSCRSAISWRYPLVEATAGLWSFLLAFKLGAGTAWLVFVLFGLLLIVMSCIDLESFLLPDVMTIPGGALALAAGSLLLDLGWQASLLGGVAGAGSFWLLQKGYKLIKGVEGLGTGDIKLMFLLGALLGWRALPLVVFFAAVSGLAVSLVFLRLQSSQGLQTAIPFGPFLSLGGMLYILCGPEVWSWYIS